MRPLALFLLCTCVRLPNVPGQLRTVGEQAASAVLLEVACDEIDSGYIRPGSGVIVDGRHIETAYHVVRCATIPVVHANLIDGRRLRYVVVEEDREHDWARLEILSREILPGPPVRRARVSPGDIVCSMPASPNRDMVCGFVREVSDGTVTSWIKTVPGNSGSGLYDITGALVGVVTSRPCLPGRDVNGKCPVGAGDPTQGIAAAVRP